ncbi:MAG TPA: DUF2911 domain-containing protein [Gemmatimonadales bacterium]
MTRLTKGLLLTALLVLAAAGGGVALYLLPVSIALGPCLKDWTNLTSYRPRESPLENASLQVMGGEIKVCYGSPSARGRIVFGSLVPYGRYWRLGANEPTRLATNVPLEIAGIAVPPGRYSLYAIPERNRWQLAISRSIFHWGTDFSDRVTSREVGRATVPAVQARPFVEALTIRLAPGETPERAKLMIEWEHTKVEVPILVKGKRE